jgi:sulfite reductase alpha subunit-like flavoprotein
MFKQINNENQITETMKEYNKILLAKKILKKNKVNQFPIIYKSLVRKNSAITSMPFIFEFNDNIKFIIYDKNFNINKEDINEDINEKYDKEDNGNILPFQSDPLCDDFMNIYNNCPCYIHQILRNEINSYPDDHIYKYHGKVINKNEYIKLRMIIIIKEYWKFKK